MVLLLLREQPLLPGDPQGVVGPQGGGAEAVGEGSEWGGSRRFNPRRREGCVVIMAARDPWK